MPAVLYVSSVLPRRHVHLKKALNHCSSVMTSENTIVARSSASDHGSTKVIGVYYIVSRSQNVFILFVVLACQLEIQFYLDDPMTKCVTFV